MSGYQKTFDNPIYLYLKEHFCPRCANKLYLSTGTAVFRGGSEIAKKQNLEIDGAQMTGNITVESNIFICKGCNFKSSIEYMKNIEFADIKMPRVYEDSNIPFFQRVKKRKCKGCGNTLLKDKKRVVLSCNSPKLKGYKIKGKYAKKGYQGDIEFIECFYRCLSCGKVSKDALY